jgi:ABC-type microcin C transport system permease subunit YejE
MTFTNPYQPTPTLRRTSNTCESGSFLSYVIAITAIWITFVAISLTHIFGSDFTFLATVLAGATIGIVSHRITLLVSRFIADILLLLLPILFVILVTFEPSPILEERLADAPGLVGIAIGFLWIETMIPIVAIVGVAKLIQKIQRTMRCNRVLDDSALAK